MLTDIVGRTRRWMDDEVAMVTDIAAHDQALVDAVDACGGVVVKHTGDGMMAVFDDPVAAVSGAAQVQRAIDATVWASADRRHDECRSPFRVAAHDRRRARRAR